MKKIFCVLLCVIILFGLAGCQLESSNISNDVPLPKRFGKGITANAQPSVTVWDYSHVPMQLTQAYIEENFVPSGGDSLLWLHKEHGNAFCIDYHAFEVEGALILYDYISDPEADVAMHSYGEDRQLVSTSVTYTTEAYTATKALGFKNGELVSYELQQDAATPDENGGYEGSTAFYDVNGELTSSEYLYAIPEAGTFRSVTFDASGAMTGAYCRATKGNTYYFAYYNKKGTLNFYEIQTPTSVKFFNAFGKEITANDVSSLFPENQQ